jgi:hypothetical protein
MGVRRAWGVLLLLIAACDKPGAPASTPPAPAAPEHHADVPPPPPALAERAAKFGLLMSGDFAWTEIDRQKTRFDWSAHPPGTSADDVEILWSFWMEKMGATETKFLVQLVAAAAANLTHDQRSAPELFEQPPDIAAALGFDRVITACFVPFEGYGKGKKQGVMHGLVKNGSLAIVAVFANDRRAVVPVSSAIGARGAASAR